MTVLANPLGAERSHYRWREYDIAYVRRGVGPPMVLVHSIHACAWSMEWRCVVPALSERFTTYSLDLLGFGASAHPARPFTAALFVELLHDFLTEVVKGPAVLVGSSLGATYLIAIAAKSPHLATALCAIGPAGISRLTKPGGAIGAAVQGLFGNPVVGRTLFSAFTSRASIRFFLKDIYFDRHMMTDEVVELYWSAARQPNAQFAPAAFIGMALNLDVRDALVAVRCPILVLWGQHASQTPLREAEQVRALRPDAKFEVFAGGDLPHEESPTAFTEALLTFMQPR